jgi:hypothetical protein
MMAVDAAAFAGTERDVGRHWIKINLDATLAITFKANDPSTPFVAFTGGSDRARAKLFVDYVLTCGSYFTATVYNSNAGYMVVTDFRGGR